MVRFLPQTEGNVALIEASGKITAKDYEELLVPKLDAMISEHGKIKCLLHLKAPFEGWEMAAAIDDLKFDIKHGGDMEKIALVGGPKWVSVSTRIFGTLMSAEVRVFKDEELTEAIAWVKS